MPHDPYRDFALVYDDWQRLYPRPFSVALAPRIQAGIRKLGTPEKSLADLACGTGTFVFWWKRTHPSWTVLGMDRSPAMIAAARRAGLEEAGSGGGAPARGSGKKPASAEPPRFFVQDLLDLALPEPVGVLTCLFDSLNHITRDQDLLRVFKRAARSVVDQGIFLFDLVDELAFPEVFTGSSILDGRDLYGGIETEYKESKGVGYGEARFTLFRRRGPRWQRINFDVKERRWFRGEIRELLQEAGFDLVVLEKIDPYSSKNFFVPRTFWACRKR